MERKEIRVSWGNISIVWDELGISFLSLPEAQGGASLINEGEQTGIESAIQDYFQGKPVKFSFKTNLSGLTAFQQEVLEAVKIIPYGETRSYLWVAKEIGVPGGSRSVGGALGKNPVAILIP